MTTKVLTAEIEAIDGLDCETIIGELAEAACNIANSHEGCSIAIADQDGDNTFLTRALEAEGHVRALLDHAGTARGAGIDLPEPACAAVMPVWAFKPEGGSEDALLSSARLWNTDLLV